MKKLIIKGMDKRYFSDKIVEWYQLNKRDLPWRQTNDPYKIWLSEIILQQTRVIQGLPYYFHFINKYPKIQNLAEAAEQDVLRLWQGLGYYSRARNLHKCAKKIYTDLNGQFPATFSTLKELPGIGEYTAAAIASFSFKEKVAVVDGNVFRVLARIFGIDEAINTPTGKKKFSTLANELICEHHPDLHNQAVMEFGATLCTPKNPDCDNCIFQNTCVANRNSLQHLLPVKLKLTRNRSRYFHYLVYKKGKSLLMKKRTEKDIWHGLYDFPVLETDVPLDEKNILKEPELKKITFGKGLEIRITNTYKHILTHQTIYCRFVIIEMKEKPVPKSKTTKLYSFGRISDLPKPVLISRFLDDNAFHS